LKKRSKKLLRRCRGLITSTRQEIKVFWFFFSKKNILLLWKLKKLRVLAFDLDGTLTDSVPDIAASVNRTLAARGFPALSEPDVAAMVGDGLLPLIQRAFAAVGSVPDESAAREYLADYESQVAVDTKLYPGVSDALAQLRADGWTLAVCTNKPERAARLLLDALGVADNFAAIGGGDSFAAHKPDPLHLRSTIEAAGGTTDRALMVGDHHNDVRAAKGCGVPAIFAGWGYGRPGMEQGAAAIARDLPSLVKIAEDLLPA
jgi:phosphoglycolate phosphatase